MCDTRVPCPASLTLQRKKPSTHARQYSIQADKSLFCVAADRAISKARGRKYKFALLVIQEKTCCKKHLIYMTQRA